MGSLQEPELPGCVGVECIAMIKEMELGEGQAEVYSTADNHVNAAVFTRSPLQNGLNVLNGMKNSHETSNGVKKSQETWNGVKNAQEMRNGMKNAQEMWNGVKNSQEMRNGVKNAQEMWNGVENTQEMWNGVKNSHETSNELKKPQQNGYSMSSLVKETKNSEDTVAEKETLADVGVLVCVFLSNLIYGIDLTGIGLFYPYLIEHFDASTAATGWITAIHGFSQAIVSLFASYPVQLYGCRSPGVIGSFLFFVGTSLSSFAPNLTVICITYGIVAGCGTGFFLLPLNVIIHQRFNRHRNLASGISLIGLSMGGILGPIVTNFAIQVYGWRGAFLILGAVHAQRILLCLFFRTPEKDIQRVRDQDRDEEERSCSCSTVRKYLKATFDFRLLRHAEFALYASAYALHTYCLGSYVPHTINRALTVGLTQGQAVTAAALASTMATIFRVAISFLVNIPKVNPSLVFGVGMYIAALSVLVIFLLPETVATMTSVALFGTHQGFTITISSVVVVYIMGVKKLPRCQAILLCTTGITRLVGSSSIGWIYDMTNDYNSAFAVIGCLAFIAGSLMILSIIVARRKKKSSSKDASSYG